MRIIALLLCMFSGYVFAGQHQDEKTSYKTKGDYFSEARAAVETLDSKTLKSMIDSDEFFVILDVRQKHEIEKIGQLDPSREMQVTRGFLEMRIEDMILDKDTPIVVICGLGFRSVLAAKTLKDMGYSDVKDFEGVMKWLEKDYPVVPVQ